MAILHFEGMYDLPSHDELREYAIILGYGDFSGKPLAWSESRTSRERSIKLHTADLDGVGWAFGALEILDDPKRALKLPTSVALLRQTVAKLGADHKTILKAGEVSFDALHNPQATWVDMLDCYKIVDEENVPAIITTSRESLQDARNAVEQKLRLIKQEAKKASGKGLDLPSDAAETLDQINAMLNFIEKKKERSVA